MKGYINWPADARSAQKATEADKQQGGTFIDGHFFGCFGAFFFADNNGLEFGAFGEWWSEAGGVHGGCGGRVTDCVVVLETGA